MAISRSDLLKELMPGLNALFDLEYSMYDPQTYITEVTFDDEPVRVHNIRNDDES
jgi:hypothetical protein